MNILITGGTGYLGRNLINKLSSENTYLFVVIRKSEDKKIFKQQKNLRFIKIKDIFNLTKLDIEKLREIHTVVHLAWYVKHKDYLNSLENIKSAIKTIELLNILEKNKVKRFMSFGTSLEKRTVNHSSEINNYVYSKKVLADYLYNYNQRSRININWIRLNYVYGGDDKKSNRLYPLIKNSLKNNKKLKLSNPNKKYYFTHIDYNVKKIIHFFKNDFDQKFLLEIKSKKKLSIKEFYNSVKINYNK